MLYYDNKLEEFLDNHWHWLYLKLHIWRFATRNPVFRRRYLLHKAIGTKLYMWLVKKYDIDYVYGDIDIKRLELLLGMREDDA